MTELVIHVQVYWRQIAYRQGYLCTWTQKSNSIQSTCSTIVTKFSKRDLFPQTLLLSNAYLQSLVISPFCTGSKWNLVSNNLNSTPSWIPNSIDFLYKKKEWWAIESKHFIIIILCKGPFSKIRSQLLITSLLVIESTVLQTCTCIFKTT